MCWSCRVKSINVIIVISLIIVSSLDLISESIVSVCKSWIFIVFV